MRVLYTDTAVRQFESLDRAVQMRISRKMRFFSEQERPLSFAKRLVGHEAFRFRIGDYRVIFEMRDHVMTVLLVVKREGAYESLD